MSRVRGVLSAFAVAALLSIAATACTSTERESVPAPTGPVTTRELVEARGLSGLAVSPDGRYAVVRVDRQSIENNRTLLEWQIIRLRDGAIVRTSDAGDPRWSNNGYLAVETPQWSPDSLWVYFRRLSGEEVQLWRVSTATGRSEQLTHDPSDVQAFIVRQDGGVLYAVGPATRDEIKAAEAIEYDRGVLLDRTIIKGFPVSHGFPVNGRMATFRMLPGAVRGRSTLLGDAPLRVFRLGTSQADSAPADIPETDRFAALWSEAAGGSFPFDPEKAGRAISAATGRAASLDAQTVSAGDAPDASRSGKVLTWRSSEGIVSACHAAVCIDADEITIAGWSADGRTLIFQSRTFETVGLQAWNTDLDTVRTVMQTEGVLGAYDSGTGGTCRVTGEEAICIHGAAAQPPQLVAVSLRTGSERILLDPNPDLASNRLGVASRITLTDRFGGTTVGRLILPQNRTPGERLPLVITSYGCRGFLLGGSGRDVPEHVLAGKGYAALCVDLGYDVVRKPPGFVPSRANIDHSGSDHFEDAVRVLDRLGIIDPARVELTGFSGGATATTYSIARSRSFTAAAVTTEGSLDPIVCYLTAHFRACAENAAREGFSRPYDSPTGLIEGSPALNVEKITAPLLMQLAEVEYESMTQLWSAMTDYDRAVEMYVFPDAYHYKNQPRQRLSVYDRNVAWAGFWLRGDETLASGAEASRWRLLRGRQCRLFAGPEALSDPPWYCAS